MNDELSKLSFDQIIQKMNELQQIEINYQQNKNPDQLRQALRNLNIKELAYLVENVKDIQSLHIVVKLYFFKFFALLNIKIKDMIMQYKDDPLKLQEMQSQFQNMLNMDFSNFNFMEKMFEDETNNSSKEQKDAKKEEDPFSSAAKNKKFS